MMCIDVYRLFQQADKIFCASLFALVAIIATLLTVASLDIDMRHMLNDEPQTNTFK